MAFAEAFAAAGTVVCTVRAATLGVSALARFALGDKDGAVEDLVDAVASAATAVALGAISVEEES